MWLLNHDRNSVTAERRLDPSDVDRLKAWYAGRLDPSGRIEGLLRRVRHERFWLACDCLGREPGVTAADTPLLHPRRRAGRVHLVRMGRGAEHHQDCVFRAEQIHRESTNEVCESPIGPELLDRVVATARLTNFQVGDSAYERSINLRRRTVDALRPGPDTLIASSLDYVKARLSESDTHGIRNAILIGVVEASDGQQWQVGRKHAVTLAEGVQPRFTAADIAPPWLAMMVLDPSNPETVRDVVLMPVVNARSMLPIHTDAERQTGELLLRLAYAVHARTGDAVQVACDLAGSWTVRGGARDQPRTVTVQTINSESSADRVYQLRKDGRRDLFFHWPRPNHAHADARLNQALWRELTAARVPSVSQLPQKGTA